MITALDNGQKSVYKFVVLPVMLLCACAVSLFIGKYRVDIRRVFCESGIDRRVFVNLRLGRTGAVLISGMALGMAGYVFQTIFRNPLASPDVAGVAGGTSVGAACAILLFSGTGIYTAPFAFIFGMLAMLLVLFLHGFTSRLGIASLVICGVCVNALCQSALIMLKLGADSDNLVASMDFWLMGSFADVTLSSFLRMLPPVLIGGAGLMILNKPIGLLSYGDDEAEMLGVNVKLLRGAALSLSTLCVAAVISTAGLVSFVGLIAPHIARLFPGKKNSLLLSGCVGGELLLISDILARVVLTNELPVSVPACIIGVPLLFILLLGRKNNNAQ